MVIMFLMLRVSATFREAIIRLKDVPVRLYIFRDFHSPNHLPASLINGRPNVPRETALYGERIRSLRELRLTGPILRVENKEEVK